LSARKVSLRQIQWIIGLDEVGRGPLAGPVVAGASLIQFLEPITESEAFIETRWLLEYGVTDSKKCSVKKRRELLEKLDLLIVPGNDLFKQKMHSLPKKIASLSLSIASCDEVEIDQLNILHASMEAMKRALTICLEKERLDPEVGLVLVDGNRLPPGIKANARAIIKGDLLEPLIGLASIGAKVYRDLFMVELDQLYPNYGLAQHAGYPTAFHLEALSNHGVSPCHRKSFRPVRVLLENQ
jgi:ribonuclease HII